MLLKKLRQENVVIGAGGSGAVGSPSSSTSGAIGAATASIGGGGVGARCRRMGGGRASSSDESSMWVGLRFREMAAGALREMERQ